MSDKLSIANEMKMFDRKVRSFYDDLTTEEKKKFSNYLMIRWGSAVEGSPDLQKFYIISTNQRLNRKFFELSKHPKLQWLLATTVSPDMGPQRHVWIAPKKKDSANNERKKQLRLIYPELKDQDIDVLAAVIDPKKLAALIKDHGDSD